MFEIVLNEVICLSRKHIFKLPMVDWDHKTDRSPLFKAYVYYFVLFHQFTFRWPTSSGQVQLLGTDILILIPRTSHVIHQLLKLIKLVVPTAFCWRFVCPSLKVFLCLLSSSHSARVGYLDSLQTQFHRALSLLYSFHFYPGSLFILPHSWTPLNRLLTYGKPEVHRHGSS